MNRGNRVFWFLYLASLAGIGFIVVSLSAWRYPEFLLALAVPAIIPYLILRLQRARLGRGPDPDISVSERYRRGLGRASLVLTPVAVFFLWQYTEETRFVQQLLLMVGLMISGFFAFTSLVGYLFFPRK